ncbi:MAG TPA: TolC family protein [Bacteroidia bacterium]|nr:TolC family protein [Bacteroidia bacterium]
MNTKKSILVAVALLCIGQLKVYSQADTAVKQFTLQAAIDYALKHNMTYLNVENDAKLNDYKRKEITGQGMPQINGGADLRDNVVLPTSLIPLSFIEPTNPAAVGQFAPVKFGVPYNLTASASVNQLIFSSDYFVALKASKELVNLSQKNILRSKVETAQNVSKAYYGVLVNKERIKILDINIDRVKTLKDNATALNQNGFAEKIDVDRLEVNYNNLVTDKEKTLRLVEISELMLKFQMGYELRASIELSDNLTKIENGEDAQNLSSDKIDPSNRPEFMVLQAQQHLNELDLKRYKMSYLPSLSGYGLVAEQFQKSNLDLGSKNWFPFAYIGATLNVPIFDGLQKNWRVQQAKVNLLKTQNSFTQLKQSIDLEVQSATVNYKNALVSLQTQKKNIALARNVYEVTKRKYEQGIGSSLDMNTTENDLHTSETNYFNSLYDLIIAKIDYQKATGTLIK